MPQQHGERDLEPDKNALYTCGERSSEALSDKESKMKAVNQTTKIARPPVKVTTSKDRLGHVWKISSRLAHFYTRYDM